ncbi:MAG: hypothetical protein FWG74_06750, partial [Planctomycetes bacterium]|nr:hypothetical protein [Planctomycetota bacterium]
RGIKTNSSSITLASATRQPAATRINAVEQTPVPDSASVSKQTTDTGTNSLITVLSPASAGSELIDPFGLCLPDNNLGSCYTLPEGAEPNVQELELHQPFVLQTPATSILSTSTPGKYCVVSYDDIPSPPAEAVKEEIAAEPAPIQSPVVTAPVVLTTLPPIPEVTDLDTAVDALLFRDNAKGSNLPEVELPPNLD